MERRTEELSATYKGFAMVFAHGANQARDRYYQSAQVTDRIDALPLVELNFAEQAAVIALRDSEIATQHQAFEAFISHSNMAGLFIERDVSIEHDE